MGTEVAGGGERAAVLDEFFRKSDAENAALFDQDGELRPEVSYRGPCVFCGSVAHRPFYAGRPLPYVRCDRCGLIYAFPRLNREACAARPVASPAKDFYFSQCYPHLRAIRGAIFREAVAVLKGILPEGRILEVGAASGFMQEELAHAGYQAEGVEPNRAACQWAKEQMGMALCNVSFADYQGAPGTYDGVVFFESLYHHFDPVASLSKAYTLLRPGGILVVSTILVDSINWRPSSAEWERAQGLDIPFLFTFATIRDMIERSGFSIISARSYGHAVRLGTILRRLVFRRTPVAGTAGRVASGGRQRSPGRGLTVSLLAPFNWLWLKLVGFLRLDRYCLLVAKKI